MASTRSITDNGAGGLSCSVAEMAKECNGCHVELDRVPLKYPGMASWEIWISESQERMTLAVPPEKLAAFTGLLERREVEATVIGRFTDTGRCVVDYHGSTVMDIDLAFLHDGLPRKHLATVQVQKTYPGPDLPCPVRLDDTLISMLGRRNICSTEFVTIQYDHTVQGGHVLGPVQGKGRVQAVATLTKVVPGSKKGVGLSQALFPAYSEIDPYRMAGAAIDTAIRGLVALGISPEAIALLDNFCWCSSDEPERLWQLKQAAKGCYDYAKAFGTPFISGKDSMFNDFSGYDAENNRVRVSVPPTLLISSIGIHGDVAKAVSLDAKVAGDLVYVIGTTEEELGGSEYFAHLGYPGATVPRLDAAAARTCYLRLTDAIAAMSWSHRHTRSATGDWASRSRKWPSPAGSGWILRFPAPCARTFSSSPRHLRGSWSRSRRITSGRSSGCSAPMRCYWAKPGEPPPDNRPNAAPRAGDRTTGRGLQGALQEVLICLPHTSSHPAGP